MDEAEVQAEKAAEEGKAAAKKAYYDMKEIRNQLYQPYLDYETCMENVAAQGEKAATPLIEEAKADAEAAADAAGK